MDIFELTVSVFEYFLVSGCLIDDMYGICDFIIFDFMSSDFNFVDHLLT
jgi:hypothetical protein